MPGRPRRWPRRTRGSSRGPPGTAPSAGSCGPRMTGPAARLAGLAVHGVPAVARAELAQLDAVGVVTAVLARDVVALLALHTRQCDLRTYVGRLGHGGVAVSLTELGARVRGSRGRAGHRKWRPLGRGRGQT